MEADRQEWQVLSAAEMSTRLQELYPSLDITLSDLATHRPTSPRTTQPSRLEEPPKTLTRHELALAEGMMSKLHELETEAQWASQETLQLAKVEVARRERDRISIEEKRATELDVLLEDGAEIYTMVSKLGHAGGAEFGFFTEAKLEAAYGEDVSRLFDNGREHFVRSMADADGQVTTDEWKIFIRHLHISNNYNGFVADLLDRLWTGCTRLNAEYIDGVTMSHDEQEPEWLVLSAAEMEQRLKRLHPGADTTHFLREVEAEAPAARRTLSGPQPVAPMQRPSPPACRPEHHTVETANHYHMLNAAAESMASTIDDLAGKTDRERDGIGEDRPGRAVIMIMAEEEEVRIESLTSELQHTAKSMSQAEKQRRAERELDALRVEAMCREVLLEVKSSGRSLDLEEGLAHRTIRSTSPASQPPAVASRNEENSRSPPFQTPLSPDPRSRVSSRSPSPPNASIPHTANPAPQGPEYLNTRGSPLRPGLVIAEAGAPQLKEEIAFKRFYESLPTREGLYADRPERHAYTDARAARFDPLDRYRDDLIGRAEWERPGEPTGAPAMAERPLWALSRSEARRVEDGWMPPFAAADDVWQVGSTAVLGGTSQGFSDRMKQEVFEASVRQYADRMKHELWGA